MSLDERISGVLNILAEVLLCTQCGTRIRYGDLDCPHCAKDLDDELRQRAERLLDKLDA